MTRTMVLPTAGTTSLSPLDGAEVHVDGGFWGERLRTNRERTIPHGLAQLEASGALGNFRHAARGGGRYVGGIDDAGLTFPFLDSDVYKWLEAVGWELGRHADQNMAMDADEVIDLIVAAQRADGYVNTYVQLSGNGPYSDLAWGHELYCIGHLMQSAVAWQRSLDDGRLIDVAARAVDHIAAALGATGSEGIDGHPEIEMALVEFFRTTHDQRYLDLARTFIERRGRGLLGSGRLGARYWQDHVSVREAPTVAGHAVRQLYLDAGAVDVAVETGDRGLLEAVLARWSDMWASRTYLTGALGSRHRDEAFGDALELPPDRAYAETCAAIANVMLSWRLLLATGETRFADAIERTLYNAVLPGLSADGTHFFYTNPLQLRPRPGAAGAAAGGRASWYPCACCPPNLMRTLATFEQLIASRDPSGIQLHQFAGGTIAADLPAGSVRLRVSTEQPSDGPVDIAVERTPDEPWVLRIRIPAWARQASLIAGNADEVRRVDPGWVVLERRWDVGDRVRLDLPMPVRFTVPDERIDASRGTVAIERGPLVYCVEGADLPSNLSIDAVEVDASMQPRVGGKLDMAPLDGLRVIHATAAQRTHPSAESSQWPYRDLDAATPGGGAAARESEDDVRDLRAIPYVAWANREPGPMRVWLPMRRLPATGRDPIR